jgi:ATP-binding cassette subfamily B (MDR/TAP) protein 1
MDMDGQVRRPIQAEIARVETSPMIHSNELQTTANDITPNVELPLPSHQSTTPVIASVNSLKSQWETHAPYFALYHQLSGRGDRLLLFLGVFLSTVAGLPLPIIGVLFGKIISTFPPPDEELRTLLGQLLAVALGYFAVTWGWAVCWGLIGEKISQGLRKQLVERLLGFDQTYYDISSQDVTNILTEQIQIVQAGTSEKVGLFIQAVSYFLAAFTVVLVLNTKLAAIVLSAVLPAMLLIIFIGNKAVAVAARKINEKSEDASRKAENAIQAVQVVQAFDAADQLCNDHARELDSKARAGIRKALLVALMLGSMFFVAYSANALAFFQGYRQQLHNHNSSNSAGTVYAVVFLIMDASFVIGQFGPLLQTFSAATTAASKIFTILNHEKSEIDVYDQSGAEASPDCSSPGILLDEISFSYPSRPSMPVLKNISMFIRSGELTGIVGESGSGKSTIASLLMRLYDPSNGQITVGKHYMRTYNVKSLRSNISYVSQDPVLFPGTILDNIKQGLGPNVSSLGYDETTKRCLTALSEAHCDFLAELPEGMHTPVGCAGFTRLSGGQKQRICLARALVGQPSLLILDEFTSALDPESESAIIEFLKRSSAATGRTTVVIGMFTEFLSYSHSY